MTRIEACLEDEQIRPRIKFWALLMMIHMALKAAEAGHMGIDRVEYVLWWCGVGMVFCDAGWGSVVSYPTSKLPDQWCCVGKNAGQSKYACMHGHICAPVWPKPPEMYRTDPATADA